MPVSQGSCGAGCGGSARNPARSVAGVMREVLSRNSDIDVHVPSLFSLDFSASDPRRVKTSRRLPGGLSMMPEVAMFSFKEGAASASAKEQVDVSFLGGQVSSTSAGKEICCDCGENGEITTNCVNPTGDWAIGMSCCSAATGCGEPVDWSDGPCESPPEEDSDSLCGPDITDALVEHYNDVLTKQELVTVWPLFGDNAAINEMRRIARANGQLLQAAAHAVAGCPKGEKCRDTVTLSDLCFPAQNIDHLLIIFYIVTSYSYVAGNLAGHWNELWGENPLGEKLADFNANNLAKCFYSRGASRWSWEAWWNKGVDLITKKEVGGCIREMLPTWIYWLTRQDAYEGCDLCQIPVPLPPGLKIPPFVRWKGALQPAAPQQ